MGTPEIGSGIQDLALFTAIRESHYVYPFLLATHLTALALSAGAILATNLRLVGHAFVAVPIAILLERLRPWKHAGFAVMVTTGALLAGSKAPEYLANPFFMTKLTLLVCVGMHGVLFRESVYRNPALTDARPLTRVAALLSLVLWFGVLSMGRWIAYYD
jgi:hypothetical protein